MPATKTKTGRLPARIVRVSVESASITAARIAQGLSQFDIAKAVDVHPSTVYRWENGSGLLAYEDALRLAEALGLDVELTD